MAQVALLNCSVLTGTAWCFHIGIAEAYFPYFVPQCTPIGNGKKEVLYCNDFRFVISFLTNCSIISINERYNPRTSYDAHRTVVEIRITSWRAAHWSIGMTENRNVWSGATYTREPDSQWRTSKRQIYYSHIRQSMNNTVGFLHQKDDIQKSS